MLENNSSDTLKKQIGNIFTMGPKVSLLFTDVHFISDIKAGFAPGFGAGIFFRIGSLIHFQPEISYSLKQFRFDPTCTQLEMNSKFFTHQLSLAALIGCSAVNNKNFKFRIFFGPEGGILLKEEYKGEKNPWTKYEFGGKAGIGFDIYHVTLDFGYRYIMSKNSALIDPYITTEYNRQNMIFCTIGYCIF